MDQSSCNPGRWESAARRFGGCPQGHSPAKAPSGSVQSPQAGMDDCRSWRGSDAFVYPAERQKYFPLLHNRISDYFHRTNWWKRSLDEVTEPAAILRLRCCDPLCAPIKATSKNIVLYIFDSRGISPRKPCFCQLLHCLCKLHEPSLP